MKAAKILLASLLGGGTALGGTATMANLGVDRAEEQVKLRQESVSTRRGGAPLFFANRAHRGGGLRGGK